MRISQGSVSTHVFDPKHTCDTAMLQPNQLLRDVVRCPDRQAQCNVDDRTSNSGAPKKWGMYRTGSTLRCRQSQSTWCAGCQNVEERRECLWLASLPCHG